MPSVDDEGPLALFPLANVVLYPTLAVPLYVFEPRYRQMIEDELDASGCIGMIAVVPEPDVDLQGDPRLFEVGCEGRIERWEKRPDGTYNILLAATRRFRVMHELDRPVERLYRSAVIEPLDESPAPAESAHLTSLRREIIDQLEFITRRRSEEGGQRLPIEQLEQIDDERLVNALAQALDFDVRDKQRLLEAAGVSERYDVLAELIRFRRAEIDSSSVPGSGVRQ
jgi:Lon protease-like protein